MPSETTLIRFHIAGRWSADDFSHLLRTSNDIYNLSVVLSADLLRDPILRNEMFPMDRRTVRRLAATRVDRPWMDVAKISFASPGFIDLAGLDTVAGHIKDFALGLLDRYQDRPFRRLELQEKLRIADRARFEDESTRNEKLALFRHGEVMRALEITEQRLKLQRRVLKNKELHLRNLDRESDFALKMSKMSKENDLTVEQTEKLGTWIDSRIAPVRELAELKQLVDVQVLSEQ